MARSETRLDPNTMNHAIQPSTSTLSKHASVLKWWPEALGWISSVLITAAIIVLLQSQSNDTWSLPSGLEAGYPYGLATNYPSVAFQDRGHLLLDFFATASDTRIQDNEKIHTASAVECILHLRARHVRAEYKNGRWSETQLGPSISVNTLEARGCSPWRRGLANGQFDLPANVIDQTGETFKVFKGAVQQDPLNAQWFSGGSPQEPLTSTCNITIPVESSGLADNLVFPALHLLNTASRPILLLGDEKGDLGDSGGIKGGILNYLVSLVSQDPSTQSSVDQSHKVVLAERVDNIAKSLTQTLRSTYFQHTVSASGVAYKDTTIYKVTWYWAIVPATLVLLTSMLLVLTAWDTAHKGLDKRADSSLALIVFGCDQGIRDALSVSGDLVAMNKAAKRCIVRLGPRHVLTESKDLQFTG